MSIVGKWYGFGQSPAYDRAVRALARSDFDEAVVEFRASLTELSDPEAKNLARAKLVQSLMGAADARIALQEYAPACSLLGDALQLRPSFADLWQRLAEAQLGLNENHDALVSADRALALNSSYSRALAIKGAALLRIDRAEEALQISFQHFPDQVHVRVSDHVREGRIEAAVGVLLMASRPQTTSASSLAEIAAEFGQKNRWVDAEDAYRQAVQNEPKWADLRCRHGESLLQLDRVQEALDEFLAAIQINPRYADAHACAGIALARLARESDALKAFAEALSIDPRHSIAIEESNRLRRTSH